MSMVTKPKGNTIKITRSGFGLFLSNFSDLNYKLLKNVRIRKITDMQKARCYSVKNITLKGTA
jgi:hypothetical protein